MKRFPWVLAPRRVVEDTPVVLCHYLHASFRHPQNAASQIAPALKEEANDRAARLRTLPTGGPSSSGPTLQSVTVPSGTGVRERPGLAITDLSARPTSYGGAGKVQRNERRAEQRKKNRAKKRAAKARA